jgi:cytochrome c
MIQNASLWTKLITTSAILVLLHGATSSVPADAVSGKAIYAAKCESCHGADGVGNVAIAKKLDIKMRPLGSAWVKLRSEASLRKDLVQGTGKMKPVKLTDEQASEVITYCRSFKQE